MNRCGSSGGGSFSCEVEPNRFLLVGVDFLGAMEVDLGVEICKISKKKKKKKKRGRGKGGQIVWGEK